MNLLSRKKKNPNNHLHVMLGLMEKKKKNQTPKHLPNLSSWRIQFKSGTFTLVVKCPWSNKYKL